MLFIVSHQFKLYSHILPVMQNYNFNEKLILSLNKFCIQCVVLSEEKKKSENKALSLFPALI